MIEFNGLLNNNGRTSHFRIYVDPNETEPYDTEFYLDNSLYEARIDGKQCIIYRAPSACLSLFFVWEKIFGICNDTIYDINIVNYNNEIIIIGKETNNCVFYKPKFFIGTNKTSV